MNKAEYIELRATQLMDFYLEDRRCLTSESRVTFTVIAAAFSACFGYVLNLFNSVQPLYNQRWSWIIPGILLLVHLGIAAAYLVLRCLTVKDIEAKGNLPSNYLLPENENCSLDELILLDSKGIGERALRIRDQNLTIARGLNNVRKAVLFAPVTWILAATAAALVA